MKRIRWLLLLVPLTLFIWAYQVASWRPKLVGVHETGAVKVPKSGRYAMVGSSEFSLLVAPDGQRLASYSYLRRNDQGSLMVWDVQSRQPLWQKTETGRFYTPLAFSRDNRSLVTTAETTEGGRPKVSLYLFDASTGKQRCQIWPGHYLNDVQSAAFLSNDELVVATIHSASVVDARTGQAVRPWNFVLPDLPSPKDPWIDQSHVSADGATIVALSNGSNQTAVALYDVRTRKRRGVWIYPGLFRNPRLSPDGTLWAMQRARTNASNFYDASTGRKQGVSCLGDEDNSPWAWSADSRHIASPRLDSVMLTSARTKRELARIAVSRDYKALALDPNGNYFYTLEDSGEIMRWRLR